MKRVDLSRVGGLSRSVALLAILLSLLFCGFIWLIPIEVIQQWAFDRAGNGTFDKFEAVGQAEFLVWLGRIVAPISLFVAGRVWFDLDRFAGFLRNLVFGLLEISNGVFGGCDGKGARVSTIGFRAIALVWAVLFASHFAQGILLCAHDWPFFRFNSGDVVLPNISESNRAVIRYLQDATPPDARILVISDQKLFFLSYYLRPRVLFHRMHPDSEHVIPLKDQQRKLLAYRLNDLSDDDLRQMPHEYILEYFEHPDFVDPGHVLDDPVWVEFLRKREQNRSLVPTYYVRLKRVEVRQ